MNSAARTASAQDPRKIDPGLRKKYDVRGPRYTSYPPATHFHAVDIRKLLGRWRERNSLEKDPGLGHYFHIPFCSSRCLFCGCHTFVCTENEVLESYVDCLMSEMQTAQESITPDRPVRQIAVGGGTPNTLSEDQLDRLFSYIHDRWNIAADAELSVEINPRTSTARKLDVFLKHGFNRYSLGIQDFSPAVLNAVKRGQGLMEVEDAVGHIRKKGIENINFDLIYGLPGQSLSSCERSALQTIRLKPGRIALYSYAHVPWIRPHQKKLEEMGFPDQDTKASMFLLMTDIFLEAGYEYIGMDHFALPDDPLAVASRNRTLRRNFMGYTTGRGIDIVGFGASAISSMGSSYSQDEKELEEYMKTVSTGVLPVIRGFLLDQDDLIRRELLLDLFCNFHADLDTLSEEFHIDAVDYLAEDLKKLEPLEKDGLVELRGNSINVTSTGRFFIRNVCMVFDRYLEADDSKRTYSRTV